LVFMVIVKFNVAVARFFSHFLEGD
jgi:hypothetical protein